MLLVNVYCGDYSAVKTVVMNSSRLEPPATAILPNKDALQAFLDAGGRLPPQHSRQHESSVDDDDDGSVATTGASSTAGASTSTGASSQTIDPTTGHRAVPLVSPNGRPPAASAAAAAAADSDDEDIYDAPETAPTAAAVADEDDYPMPDLNWNIAAAAASSASPLASSASPLTTPDESTHSTLAASPSTAPGSPFNTTAHGVEWTTEFSWEDDINGPHHEWEWSVKDPHKNIIAAGSDPDKTLDYLDYFLLMFPTKSIRHTVNCTNHELLKHNHSCLTVDELFKFFGVLLLLTKCEFTNWSDLWSSNLEHRKSKYLPPTKLGKVTRLHRERFDHIWSCWRMSNQPDEQPLDTPWEDYNWMLVQDFTDQFNDHRKATFTPSTYICVDESITRWYGIGADYINLGHPHPLYID
jgi:hypothetical protein